VRRWVRSAGLAVVTSAALVVAASTAASANTSMSSSNKAPKIEWIAPLTLLDGEVAWFRAWVTDEDGTAITYHWDLGDGTTFSGSAATGGTPPLLHTYDTSGTYVVELTVDDGVGGVTSASVTVVVLDLPVGETGLLRNRGSATSGTEQCITANTYVPYIAVSLAPCDWSGVEQWTFVDGTFRGVNSGMCLTAPDSVVVNGVLFIEYCYGGGRQQWRPENLGSDGSFRIRNVERDLCMDLTSYHLGSPVTLYPCYGAASQRWSR